MAQTRRIAVVTGSRAEYGLLRPVMRAIAAESHLELLMIVAGSHLLPPARTIRDVEAAFDVEATVEMQDPDRASTRCADARALGRGISGFADAFEHLQPDIVLVLGDRIEAFAAAAAASVGGIPVAHVHGGDRAEGIADEAMRHAITKLAHLHFPATEQSAERIIRMGEPPETVHVVGSPAIDELSDFPALDDGAFESLGSPQIVFLMHPIGRGDDEEERVAQTVLGACADAAPTLALHPNFDAGRQGIIAAIEAAGVRSLPHLPRKEFIGLLRRAKAIVGNSSAGLIECAAIGVWSIDIGPRQAGRERPGNVIDLDEARTARDLPGLLGEVLSRPRYTGGHACGDGRAGERLASILAGIDLDSLDCRKRNTY